MKRSAIVLAAALSLAGLAVHAESPDPSGQFAARVPSFISRAQVEAELRDFKQQGIDPWAKEYNPLASFHSSRTRAEVAREFLGSREEVAAMNAEDSGSRYLAARRESEAPRQLAGTPRSAH